MHPRRGAHAVLTAACTGLVTLFGAMLAIDAVSAGFGLDRLAIASAAVGMGLGAAVFAGVALLRLKRGGWRRTWAAGAAVLAGAVTVMGVGPENLPVMAVGLRLSCRMGLGQCISTGIPSMPVVERVGPVQSHPVVRLVLWGATPGQASAAERIEARADSLAQPLLRAYGVHPAADGGRYDVPGSPRGYLRARHQKALSAGDLGLVIARVRRATGWPDSHDSQWWIVTDLTSRQMGIRGEACGDHIRLPRTKGVVVRFPLGSCSVPSRRAPPDPSRPCSPVAAVRPGTPEPRAPDAAIDLIVTHEFAEAATDPQDGWRVLVAPVCRHYLLLEIADVCAPNGQIISAPAYRTAAGWQPSMLELEAGGGSRCADPARARRSKG